MNIPSVITSVCFTGHRVLSKSEERFIKEQLPRLLGYLINNHKAKDFYAGGALGFDTIASKVVLDIQKEYRDIKLNLILPCSNQESTWSDIQKDIYKETKEKANSVRILSPYFYNGCMQARNKELLLSADLCIAYLRSGTSGGGSLNTVIQATKMGVPVINLADPESEYIYEISK